MDVLLKILHVEDEPLDSELAGERLAADGLRAELHRVDTLAGLRQALLSGQYDLVLSDYTLPSLNPLEGLRLVRELRPELPFIFLSGTIGEELATQALKLGANDYVLKQRIEHLATTVRRALAESGESHRRREAEEALRRSEERLRLAQEVARIGTFEWNVETGASQWSPEMEALHGLPSGSFAGTYDAWKQYVHPEDVTTAEQCLQRALVSGDFEGEWRILLPGGNVRWIAARGHAFRDASGTPVRVVGVNIDITQRKRDEEALRAAKYTAERAKEIAEEANHAKDRFLAILSHELRTPLTAVLPALDAMAPLVPEDAREYLAMASRNVALEAKLIDDLLDITRIARGKIELQRQPVDVCDILRRAAEVCHADIDARGLHFLLRVEDEPHLVEADAPRLQQVFWNLIQNAVKFTPRGGCIGVRIRKQNDNSVIEVIDSGTGIEGEALARIFNAFEQEAKSITRQFGGLGLGLAISKTLTEMHGGTITAQSAGKGRGASFSVSLPLAQAAAEPARDTPDKLSAAAPTNLRILLVEDHPDTARILGVLLRKAGHTVQHAPDITTALQLGQSKPFDLLISDLGLPDGTGHDLMRQLIASGHRLPAIALSGYGTTTDIDRSRAAGFLEHLVKPINFPTLQETVTRIHETASK